MLRLKNKKMNFFLFFFQIFQNWAWYTLYSKNFKKKYILGPKYIQYWWTLELFGVPVLPENAILQFLRAC